MYSQNLSLRSNGVVRVPTDADYEAAVAMFIQTKGVTRCPTACLVPTQATIAADDRALLRQRAVEAETRRLAQLGRSPASTSRPKAAGGQRMIPEVGAKGREAHKAAADRFATRILPIVEGIRAGGAVSLAAIADELNNRGVGAPRGGKWRGSAVRRLLDRSPL